MEEENKIIKRKNIEIAILSFVVILLLGLCAYMVFIKPKDNIKKDTNIQENKQGTNKEFDSSIDLSKVDEIKTFTVMEFNPEKLSTLQGEKTFNVGSMENTTLNIKIENKKAVVTYKSNKTITREFSDVKNVYYVDYSGCSTNVYVYIFSGNKLFLVKLKNVDEDYSESDLIKEIDNSKKYDVVYEQYLHSATCDHYSAFLGKTSDGKYYDLETGVEFVDKIYYYYDNGNNYIKNDKTYKFGDNTGKIKFAFIDEGDETLDAYIDENNYLYEEGDNGYKLNSNSKVVKIEYVFDNYPRYVIYLDSGITEEISYTELYK